MRPQTLSPAGAGRVNMAALNVSPKEGPMAKGQMRKPKEKKKPKADKDKKKKGAAAPSPFTSSQAGQNPRQT